MIADPAKMAQYAALLRQNMQAEAAGDQAADDASMDVLDGWWDRATAAEREDARVLTLQIRDEYP